MDTSQFGIDLSKTSDQSQETKGGDLPPRAKPVEETVDLRLVSYVEVGTQPQRAYQGEAKPPKPEAVLQFQVLSQREPWMNTYEGEEGKQERIFPFTITVTLPISTHQKASFFKLFKAMAYGRDITHMVQMVGDSFVGNTHVRTVQKDGKDVHYVNLKNPDTGAWDIGAPMIPAREVFDENDEPTGEIKPARPKKILPATLSPRVLLWDQANKAMWDSLFVGIRPDDNGRVESWLATKCTEAINFEGSVLANVLSDVADIDTPMDIPEDSPEEEPEDDKPSEDTSSKETSEPAEEDDPLAALLQQEDDE